jgi:hypothetical protein
VFELLNHGCLSNTVSNGLGSYMNLLVKLILGLGIVIPLYLMTSFTNSIFDYSRAKDFPMQLLGPPLKPANAYG